MDAKRVDTLAKEILNKVGAIIGIRVYLAILDGTGKIIYIDQEMVTFRDFIVNFVKYNFKYLKIGDHSLPISGKNIIFFRYPKSMLVMFSLKGRVGQLLAFKSIMPKYQASVEELIGDIVLEPAAAELVAEAEAKPAVQKPVTITPVILVEKTIFSRINTFYKEIFPKVTKKIKEGAKFNLTTSVILNYSTGNSSFSDIFEKLKVPKDEYIKELFKLFKANVIQIPNYEFLQLICPTCKSEAYQFLPTSLLKASPHECLRFQLFPSCNHSCYVIIDKKGKIKTNIITKISDLQDEIDFSELSIEKLIKFFGQDAFFAIFHSIFFKYSVLFLESDKFAEKISSFMKNFFLQVSYGKEIQSLPRAEYEKMSKKYADSLVIDLASNIIVNEPYEPEDFDFELRLFRKVLQEKDMKIQILKTHSEFERLILLIDTILNEIEMYQEIKEDELINIMKQKHNIVLERSEIPVIKELADIYYSVDIRKKITRTLVGKVSDFFESF